MSELYKILGELDPAKNRAYVERIDSIYAQRKLQSDRTDDVMVCFPHDGYCYSCKADLAVVIKPDRLRTVFITGCPKCHCSFVE